MINIKKTKKYCCEDISLIENYEQALNDETQIYDIHHKLEIQDGVVTSAKELINQGRYWNRPAEELIFIAHSEHTKLHNTGENHPMFGKHHSTETKQKMAESHKGKCCGENHPMYGCCGENHPFYGKHHSSETKQKISNALKGENNPWFGKHLSDEHKQKTSNSLKGKPHPKVKWRDPEGNIHIMDVSHAKRYHPTWTKIEEEQ